MLKIAINPDDRRTPSWQGNPAPAARTDPSPGPAEHDLVRETLPRC